MEFEELLKPLAESGEASTEDGGEPPSDSPFTALGDNQFEGLKS